MMTLELKVEQLLFDRVARNRLAGFTVETANEIMKLITSEPQTAWMPIDTAPKDGLSILLGWAGSSASEGRWHDGSSNYWKLAGFYFSDDDLLTAKPCQPTHWTHLPDGPVVAPAERGTEA